MIKMLDTNTCIYVMNKRYQNVLDNFAKHSPSELLVSSISVAELYFGAFKSQRVTNNIQTTQVFLQSITIVHFEDATAYAYGDMRNQLQQLGNLIGPLDMLIAAHALSLGATLVTNNIREFARVPNLLLENWVTI